jgi:hypothetical protein
MNLRASCLAGIVAMLGLCPPAFGQGEQSDRADQLVKEGEALGKAGDFDSALERFREAEELESRPVHDCWIAISYVRLEQWTRARLYLDRCKSRSNGKPEVEWYPTARSQLRSKMRGGYAAVTVNVDVAGATLKIPTVPDEELALPVTIWLPLGRHNLIVSRDGYPTRKQIVTLSSPERMSVLIAVGDGSAQITNPDDGSETSSNGSSSNGDIDLTTSTEDRQQPPGKLLPVSLMAGGAVIAGFGFVFISKAKNAQDDFNNATNPAEQQVAEDAIKSNNRNTAIAFISGGVVGAVGIALLVRAIAWKPDREQSMVNVGPTADGGAVVWWSGRF